MAEEKNEEIPETVVEQPVEEHQPPADLVEAVQPLYQNTKWRLLSEVIWLVPVILLLVILSVVGFATSEGMRSGRYLTAGLMPQVLYIALMVPPMVLIMASGGIDLSVGGIATLAASVTAIVVTRSGSPILALLAALALAGVIGLINGLLVGVARVTSVVATLGMYILLQGITFAMIETQGIRIESDGLLSVLPKSPLTWGLLVLLTIACVALVELTPFGRRPRPGSEDDQESWLTRAFFVGTPYVLSGLMAGLAGIVLVGRTSFIFPNMGVGLEQMVILAALIGGTPPGWGFGNVLGGVLSAGVVVLLNEIARTMQIEAGLNAALLLRGVSFVIAALAVHLYYMGVRWLYRKRLGEASERVVDA